MSKSFATTESIVLAGGCFWCLEAIFKRLTGVNSVVSGYTGGEIKNPSYETVSSGTSGHAEAVQVEFSPSVISLKKILDVFWELHDPTTLNRQGNDIGTQYRSEIFYTTEAQKQIAEKSLKHIEDIQRYDDQIVTQISKLKAFYPAENYHSDFYNQNRTHGYCRLVIDPKIKKLYTKFKENVFHPQTDVKK